jgi:hypothetical protein
MTISPNRVATESPPLQMAKAPPATSARCSSVIISMGTATIHSMAPSTLAARLSLLFGFESGMLLARISFPRSAAWPTDAICRSIPKRPMSEERIAAGKRLRSAHHAS